MMEVKALNSKYCAYDEYATIIIELPATLVDRINEHITDQGDVKGYIKEAVLEKLARKDTVKSL